MAELTPRDRLQPCLLDRLTDNEPEVSKESRDQRIVSIR
ncbi:MAG: type VI secretion system baseplate subunit TssE, partial [Planctomycetota bacterium]